MDDILSKHMRAVHVSSLATVFESVYESTFFLFFFVLRFITNPPQSISGIGAFLLFFACKAIQVLNDALIAFVINKYERIHIVEYVPVKTLKREVLFWWVTLFGVSFAFLRITGNMWDPSIKLYGAQLKK